MSKPLAVVAGAAGFLGAHIARELEASHDVVGIGSGTTQPHIDAATFAALPRAPALIVLACGSNSVAASFQDPQRDLERTLPPALAALTYCRLQPAPRPRVVVLSSGAVYGDAPVLPTPEDAACRPVSPYGLHRVLVEELAAGWANLFSIPVAVLRLFSVYGAGLRRQLLWEFGTRAQRGPVELGGTGNESRDWIHVTDAARLVVAAAESASEHAPIFNGGSGERTRVGDLLGVMCAELGAPPPRFTGAHRPGDPRHTHADISKARALGWAPRVSLDEGLRDVARWIRTER